MRILEKLQEISQLRLELDKETDRGCALLGVSYLDEELKELIQSYLVQNNTIQKKIFDNNGGLATLSSKIDIAFLLGLISKETYNDLNYIRKIRNEFAHSKYSIDFNNKEVSKIIKNLKSHYRDSSESSRKIFISTIYGILSKINILKDKVENIKERKEDATKEQQLKDSMAQHRANIKNYHELLIQVHKDSPNKEELIRKEMMDYIKDVQEASVKVLKTVEKTTPPNNV
ncbi:MltR family transcriptional regulator [Rufibacter quisquiliarum]|uniref:DNA-binding MltR family transcriptional regulator n=1 Tax=Rufibacter quisquiliarum TaxID=1549639 RepID=A0A839GUW0_9BACT|nr:MltR family transcriptional regulator [Rufibacter quisquiliarum]MBA9078667.1 DNA-binding MltR family transcriptional regulator [Rufibacter quisquiliarum]